MSNAKPLFVGPHRPMSTQCSANNYIPGEFKAWSSRSHRICDRENLVQPDSAPAPSQFLQQLSSRRPQTAVTQFHEQSPQRNHASKTSFVSPQFGLSTSRNVFEWTIFSQSKSHVPPRRFPNCSADKRRHPYTTQSAPPTIGCFLNRKRNDETTPNVACRFRSRAEPNRC